MTAGWETKPLGEVCQFRGGGTPSKQRKDFWNGSIPWVSPKDMKSVEISDSIDHITDSAIKSSATTLIPSGSILLVVRSGILARTVPIGITSRELAVNQDLKALVPGSDVDPWFLYYALKANEQALLATVTRGATVHRLSSDVVKSLRIPLPPLEEQKRIVAILDAAFADIDAAEASTRLEAQSVDVLFQEVLDGSIRDIGDQISTVRLEDVLSVQPRNGWSPPAAFHSDSGTPVLTLSAVTGFTYDGTRIKFTSANTDADAHYWVKPGDLLITRSNTPKLVGHVAICGEVPSPTIYPDLVMRLRVNNDVTTPEFLYWSLRTTRARTYMSESSGGASQTMSKITKAVVQRFELQLPPLPAQDAAVGLIQEVQAEVNQLRRLLQRKAGALTDLRQSLLHQAFSGQL